MKRDKKVCSREEIPRVQEETTPAMLETDHQWNRHDFSFFCSLIVCFPVYRPFWEVQWTIMPLTGHFYRLFFTYITAFIRFSFNLCLRKYFSWIPQGSRSYILRHEVPEYLPKSRVSAFCRCPMILRNDIIRLSSLQDTVNGFGNRSSLPILIF